MKQENTKNLQLIANRIRTPDGTILWSRYGHDCVFYKDDNGEMYMLDGGNDYVRITDNKEPAESLCVYDDAPFEEIRQVMLRGTFDKDMCRVYVPLCKLNNSHLPAILQYNKDRHIISYQDKFIEQEIEYRKEHNIFIEDKQYTEEDGVEAVTVCMTN